MTMAYLDLAAPGSVARATPEPMMPARLAVALAGGFSQREWSIIRLAREDRLSSLREESKVRRFLRLFFGFERKTPLSNPTLEALRRIAVQGWHHGYNVSSAEISAFLAAGYSIDQYDVLLAHIGRERAASARRTRR
jgi:hypothetical protein